ncbi:hypothetical protein ACIQI8_41220 [Streptomyces sp. NPDC092369]|uniref:hypothetical protein n=1 Tax=Streptomyces sp. NPDC092369 TaxID=3366015 RepID=UPI00381A2F08
MSDSYPLRLRLRLWLPLPLEPDRCARHLVGFCPPGVLTVTLNRGARTAAAAGRAPIEATFGLRATGG